MNDAGPHNTGYARLTRLQAGLVLAVMVCAFVGAIAVTLSPLASSNMEPHPNERGDIALYRAEVERIHGGEGYYQAAAAELTARGYPTRSVFNWRTPLPVWLLGKLPSLVSGKAILVALSFLLMLMTFEGLAREEDVRANAGARRLKTPVLCVLLLTGPLLPTVLGDLLVVPVLWAGVLLGLSVAAYGIERPRLGVAFGLAAVFFRELALPYGVLCAAIAWRRGRRRECAAWLIGLAAWTVFFAFHWWQVHDLMAVGARAHRHGWIQFGGVGFIISLAQMNAYLLLLPQWVTAIYLVSAMVGFAGWSTPLGTRVGLTTCLFIVAFAVVGQRFNQYWGALFAPLLCFGVAKFPASLIDLLHAALPRPAAPTSVVSHTDNNP